MIDLSKVDWMEAQLLLLKLIQVISPMTQGGAMGDPMGRSGPFFSNPTAKLFIPPHAPRLTPLSHPIRALPPLRQMQREVAELLKTLAQPRSLAQEPSSFPRGLKREGSAPLPERQAFPRAEGWSPAGRRGGETLAEPLGFASSRGHETGAALQERLPEGDASPLQEPSEAPPDLPLLEPLQTSQREGAAPRPFDLLGGLNRPPFFPPLDRPHLALFAERVIQEVRSAIRFLSTSLQFQTPQAEPLRAALAKLEPTIQVLVEALEGEALRREGAMSIPPARAESPQRPGSGVTPSPALPQPERSEGTPSLPPRSLPAAPSPRAELPPAPKPPAIATPLPEGDLPLSMPRYEPTSIPVAPYLSSERPLSSRIKGKRKFPTAWELLEEEVKEEPADPDEN